MGKGPPPAHQIDAGIALFRRGKYEKALRHFRKASRRLPDDPEAHMLQALACYKLGRYADAVKANRAAQSTGQAAIVEHCMHALACKNAERPDLARNAALEASRVSDMLFRARYAGAKASFRLGRHGDAMDGLGEDLELDPDDPGERAFLYKILKMVCVVEGDARKHAVVAAATATAPHARSSGLGDALAREFEANVRSGAERALRKDEQAALEASRDPGNAAPRAASARVLHGMCRHAEALESIGAALEMEPKNAGYLCTKAEILRDLGRPGECDEAVDAALAVKPDRPDAGALKGLRLYEEGRLEEGRLLVRTRHARDPLDPTVCFCMAYVTAADGFRDPVLILCKQAVLDHPNDGRLAALLVAILNTFAGIG